MSASNVLWDIDGTIATVTFARPDARNAMTWDMYDALVDACDRVDSSGARVLIIRGSEGAFSAGTDITQFLEVRNGVDGVAYERRIGAVIDRVAALDVPTIASIEGPAVGGGCAIALACDVRVCSPTARLGVPVARTLGNCLAAEQLARFVDLIGEGRTADIMLSGRLLSAEEALAWGLVSRVVPTDDLDDATRALAADLAARASSTIRATKEMLRRLRAHRRLPPGACDDVLAACYDSPQFREGVTAFAARRTPAFG